MKTLDDKSQKMLMILIESDEPVTTNYVAEKLNISSRTVLRKMPFIEQYLKENKFKFIKKPGYGIMLKEDAKGKDRLKNLLQDEEPEKKYTPEERQLFILVELLKSKEPIKTYKFKSDLDVTEGTISSDLDSIEKSIAEYSVKLVRKPGLGVYIKGSEIALRKLMAKLIHKNSCSEDVLSILRNPIENNAVIKMPFKLKARNKLLNVVDKDIITKLEKIIYDLEKSHEYALKDNQYVALIIHIALVIERIMKEEKIVMENKFLKKIKENEEFNLAQELAIKVNEAFHIILPEEEVGYIAMHLMASRKYFMKKNEMNEIFFIEKYKIIKIAKKMIKFVESQLNVEIMQDDKLLVDLAIHLEPAIKRISMNMDIRNPLLNQIKENYPNVFQATKNAVSILKEELRLEIPESEVAYIALHIGGALERTKAYTYKVLVVCPSGVGTSSLLSAKLENEFLNIKVIDTASIVEIEGDKVDFNLCDFVISTVEMNFEGFENVIVSPLLLEEDKEKIIHVMSEIKKKSINKQKQGEKKDFKTDLKKKINYGNAIMEVLNNFRCYEGVHMNSYEEIIDEISKLYTDREENYKRLKKDIKKREALGSFILEESATMLIHCRSSAIEKLYFGVVKLDKELQIEENMVELIIVQLAPETIQEEYRQCMSRISQELFKEKLLKDMTQNEIYEYINSILKQFYLNMS